MVLSLALGSFLKRVQSSILNWRLRRTLCTSQSCSLRVALSFPALCPVNSSHPSLLDSQPQILSSRRLVRLYLSSPYAPSWKLSGQLGGIFTGLSWFPGITVLCCLKSIHENHYFIYFVQFQSSLVRRPNLVPITPSWPEARSICNFYVLLNVLKFS